MYFQPFLWQYIMYNDCIMMVSDGYQVPVWAMDWSITTHSKGRSMIYVLTFACADIGLLCFITGYSEMLTGFLSLEQSKLHMASWSPPAFSFPPLRASSLSSRLSSCSKSTLSHLLTLYAHGWRTEKTGESSVVPKGSCSLNFLSCEIVIKCW